MRQMSRLALIPGIAAAACSVDVTGPSDIVSRTWHLMSLQQENSDPIDVGGSSRYTLTLDHDGRAAVRSDCNTCSGTYTLDGSALELGQMACTKVFCGDASLDPQYVRALEGSKTVSVDGSELTLTGGGITLRFRQ